MFTRSVSNLTDSQSKPPFSVVLLYFEYPYTKALPMLKEFVDISRYGRIGSTLLVSSHTSKIRKGNQFMPVLFLIL